MFTNLRRSFLTGTSAVTITDAGRCPSAGTSAVLRTSNFPNAARSRRDFLDALSGCSAPDSLLEISNSPFFEPHLSQGEGDYNPKLMKRHRMARPILPPRVFRCHKPPRVFG